MNKSQAGLKGSNKRWGFKTREKIAKYVIGGGLALFLIYTGVSVFQTRQLKMECLNWQSQAKELTNFEMRAVDKQNCDQIGVKVEAPVQQLKRMY